MKHKARKYFLIAVAVILVDQVVKLIVKLNMELRDEIPILGDFFKIHFIENEGAAFGLTVGSLLGGLGIDISPETGKIILTIFSIIAVGAIAYVLYRLSGHRSPLPTFLAMILGGALGNIIDRTFYGIWFSPINDYDGGLFFGRVVDMFYIDIWHGTLPNWIPLFGGDYLFLWPIFNIADSAIFIGIIVILIFQGKFFKMDSSHPESENKDAPAKSPEKEPASPAIEAPTPQPEA